MEVYVFGAWPSWLNYQPLYPLIAGFLRRAISVEVLYWFNVVLYLAAICVAWRVGRKLFPLGGYMICAMLVLNLRAYLYIANLLTEIPNLFLFFATALALLQWRVEASSTRLTLQTATICALLIAVSLTREPNALANALLAIFVCFHPKEKLPQRTELFVSCVVAFVFAFTYSSSAHREKSNVGLNFHTFIERACARTKCPDAVFSNPDTPVMREHWQMQNTVSGIRDAFAKRGYEPFSLAYSGEMRKVYLRLLANAPTIYLRQVIRNWFDLMSDRTIAIYPEDTNLRTVASGLLLVMATISTSASILAAAIAPAVLCIFAYRVANRNASILEVWFGGWVVCCLTASLLLFAAS